MPRSAKSTTKTKARHDPLHLELREDAVREKYGSVTRPGKRQKKRGGGSDEESGDVILDPVTSRRIFELAKDQQDELEELEDDSDKTDPEESTSFNRVRSARDTIDEEDEDEMDAISVGDEDVDAEEYAEIQIDAADLATLDALLPRNTTDRRTLADIIFSKIEEQEAQKQNDMTAINQIGHARSDGPRDPAEGLNPKVVEVYSKIGELLSRYKSGPLPKAFKIVPSLTAWARILALTKPENWTPHATRAATRIFISNMKPPQARVFLEGVVLDAIREDIRENGKLNVHYYETLTRALYKPAAFFKGIIFPLLEKACTLKEAAIIASVLAKVRIPMVHSAAALLRLANMDYTGPNSLFIRILIDKKYALPYKVVDGLVFHFIRLSNTYKAKKGGSDKLPVLWHQSLLVFAQRYASDLTPEQKDALLDVIKASPHHQISPEVRRELLSSTVRGAPRVDVDVEMS